MRTASLLPGVSWHFNLFSSPVYRFSTACLLFLTLQIAVVAAAADEAAPEPTASRHPRARAAPSIPAYTPIVTPAPDQAAILSKMGYKQETYYSCNTFDGQQHCGWHVPIVQAVAETAIQGSLAPGTRTDTSVVAAVLACVAGIFAFGLM
ncbi:hypothetical protein VHEMI00766 [[Torrubiella] hemipterigena]|uniref:Uncharacterized protein n=1 Tax=[Torrubiella] hemipterigena TaxID=1531966 RepID=A0A0A1T3C2_9HYPO|nr:hypothetical protein VHEMI00766 [[Torrubiella] hemipterigena]